MDQCFSDEISREFDGIHRQFSAAQRRDTLCGQRQEAASAWAITSRKRPVLTSKMKPRTGTSFEIQGCDLTISIWSLVCCSGSLKAKKRIGAGVASPVSLENLAFNSASVKVVNPQPV